MPKFTLIAEHTDLNGNPDGTKIQYEFYVDGLSDVLEHVDLFIKGCGYVPTGTLDYVDEFAETNMDFGLEQDFDTYFTEPESNVPHSEYYFDFDRNKPATPWPYPTNGESK